MSTEPTKPNMLVAVGFGLLAPGAGLYYAGKPKVALAILAVFLLSVVGLPYLAVHDVVDPARLPTLLALTAILAWGPAAIFGALTALRASERPRPPWLHPWWVLGVVVASWAASSLMRTHIVVPDLVQFAQVEDHRFEPDVAQGALVVVKKSYAPAEVKAGAFVLVTVGTGDTSKQVLHRVLATDSGIVLDDGTRVGPADVVGVGFPAR